MLSKSITRLLLTGVLASLLSACGGGNSAPKGDAVRGKELYAACAACHHMTENFTGPMHCNLFGRPAGTVPGYAYSEAMQAAGFVWDAQKLDEFLVSPIAVVVGTKMGFAGFQEPKDRADLIAYLWQFNHDPASCPTQK
jgi:Cytochrome c2